ncbi:MAG: sugar phosphate isomerase/epimerase, partial [Alicyclobacillus sp.]|nr:sugar phosphate isomerase/epimerase [Alicyclobacillus sp.]
MKIALSMWSTHKHWYRGEWGTVDFLRFAATTGAEGVELLSVFWRDRDREIPQIQAALSETGLKVACFSACNNVALTDEAKWREQVKDITDSVDAAVTFGAKVVRVFSGDKEGDATFEAARANIIAGLKEGAAYAASKGVTLCLENHGLFAGKADQVLDIIHAVGSDALRSTFDTGNFLLVDESPMDAIGKLKPFVGHVHFKDFLKVPDDYPGETYRALSGQKYVGKIAGEGEVDLRAILSELKGVGYDGWLTVEFEGQEEEKAGSLASI